MTRSTRNSVLALLAAAMLLAPTAAMAQSQNPTKGLFGRKQDGPVPDPDRDRLAPEELKLDCKKLAGRMQIRIMQVRADRPADHASSAASTLQSMTRPLYGGGKFGTDTARQTSRDRAWLEAANKQLAAKGCRTYDLAAELAKPSNAPPPSLQPKAARK